MYKKRLHF